MRHRASGCMLESPAPHVDIERCGLGTPGAEMWSSEQAGLRPFSLLTCTLLTALLACGLADTFPSSAIACRRVGIEDGFTGRKLAQLFREISAFRPPLRGCALVRPQERTDFGALLGEEFPSLLGFGAQQKSGLGGQAPAGAMAGRVGAVIPMWCAAVAGELGDSD